MVNGRTTNKLANPLNALGVVAVALLVSCGPDAAGSSTPGTDRAPAAEVPQIVAPTQEVPEDATAIGDDLDLGTSELSAFIRDRAAEANEYIFLLFYRISDEQTGATKKDLAAALAREGGRALSAAIDVDDPLERSMVEEYGADRAPTPLVLAVAPSGAVTKAWPGRFDGAELTQAFVSPCEADCLAHLQQGKLVLLCIQNDQTQKNAEAMKGVRALASDASYAAATAIVTADPSAEAEVAFLEKLRVDRANTQAITVLLAPPGQPLGSIVGPTSKDTLLGAISKGLAACSPGSGCCPPK